MPPPHASSASSRCDAWVLGAGAGAGADDGDGDDLHGFVLADDAFAYFFFGGSMI